jgi:hypothetical protein
MRCTCEITSRIAILKAAFNMNKALFTSIVDSNLRKKLMKCLIWHIALYGPETWTLQKIGQKYLGSSEMCCRREVSWTNRVRNVVLQRVKEDRNILQTTKKDGQLDWSHHAKELSSRTHY